MTTRIRFPFAILAPIFGFAALLATGCSAAPVDLEEGTGVTREALGGFLGPFSEEAGMNTGTCGEANIGIDGAGCEGDYCDDITLHCAKTPVGVTTGSTFTTSFISEEDGAGGVRCESRGPGTGVDGIMDGISVAGQYADDIALRCRKLTKGVLRDCAWTAHFATSDGFVSFGKSFVIGARCQGSYCAEMSYQVCKLAPN